MNCRTSIAALPISLFVLGCDNTPAPAEELVAENKSELRCKIARKDTNRTKDCHCVEFDDKGDTISEGTFHLDSVGHPLFRRGWHTFYSDSGTVRIHYTAIQYHADSSFNENADQTIHISSTGDTLFEQSTWWRIEAPDTISIGSPFSARFNYLSPARIDSFYVGTIITRPDAENNVNFVERKRYGVGHYDSFVFQETPIDTGHFTMRAVAYGFTDVPNTDSMHVVTSFVDFPFIVVP